MSCHVLVLIHMQLLRKTLEDKYFFSPHPCPRCKSNACVCLQRVIQSSCLSPSNSSGFTSAVRNVSPLSDDQTSHQATRSLWKWFSQIFSAESRFKIKLMIRLVEIASIERLMNIWLLLVAREHLSTDGDGLEPHRCVFSDAGRTLIRRQRAYILVRILDELWMGFFFSLSTTFILKNKHRSWLKFSVSSRCIFFPLISRLACVCWNKSTTWSKWNSCCKMENYNFF